MKFELKERGNLFCHPLCSQKLFQEHITLRENRQRYKPCTWVQSQGLGRDFREEIPSTEDNLIPSTEDNHGIDLSQETLDTILLLANVKPVTQTSRCVKR